LISIRSAQLDDLGTVTAAQLARACAVFQVDELMSKEIATWAFRTLGRGGVMTGADAASMEPYSKRLEGPEGNSVAKDNQYDVFTTLTYNREGFSSSPVTGDSDKHGSEGLILDRVEGGGMLIEHAVAERHDYSGVPCWGVRVLVTRTYRGWLFELSSNMNRFYRLSELEVQSRSLVHSASLPARSDQESDTVELREIRLRG
ncbi:hypothetical protein KCU89_g137, partial [Aureobasidium melanogenum]